MNAETSKGLSADYGAQQLLPIDQAKNERQLEQLRNRCAFACR